MSTKAKHHLENARALRFAALRTSFGIARTMFYMMAINEMRKARTCNKNSVLQ